MCVRQGRKQVLLRPSSKIVIKFLKVMQSKGYIGEFEVVEDHASNKVVVELLGMRSIIWFPGRLNKCAVISPRYDVTLGGIEQWTNNVLPARFRAFLNSQDNSGTWCWPPTSESSPTMRPEQDTSEARFSVSSTDRRKWYRITYSNIIPPHFNWFKRYLIKCRARSRRLQIHWRLSQVTPKPLNLDKLYWISDKQAPRNQPNAYYFCID